MTGLSQLPVVIVAAAAALAAGVARAQWTLPSSPLPDATEGVAYSLQLTASGGVGGYAWSIGVPPPCGFGAYCPNGTGLPPGLSLARNGLVQGTPATGGDFDFWLGVGDSTGAGAVGLYRMHVRPSPAWAFSTWVPVATHGSGINGAEWRTDVWILNPSSSAANVEVDFHGAAGIVSMPASVPAGAQRMLPDVVGRLGAGGSGALEVLSDQPVKATSRTYNQFMPDDACFPGGTVGQDYPGLDPADGLQAVSNPYPPARQSALLLGLVENAGFRSNIGLVNTGLDAATVLVELFDGASDRLASYTVVLGSGDWSQATRPFKTLAGQTAMESGYAKITVQSGSGVFAFASVVDNATNAPITVTPASGYVVPVASHVSGLNGAEWRTDVGILNPGASAVGVDLKFYGADGVVSSTITVAAGAQLMVRDVVEQLGASGSGTLWVSSSGWGVWVTSRTYDEFSPDASCFPGGTQGQGYPVLDPADGLRDSLAPFIDALQIGYLPGLVENASYRCNVGLAALGGPATVLVELFDGSGNRLTDYTVALESGQWSQALRPFRKLAGQTAMDSGYAKITVQSGGGVFAFASVIDTVTNDPTTVTMQVSVQP